MYTGGTTLSSLNKVFHDGYHPNADRLTTARTISLTGDVSGSTSFNGSANVSITATVADDSHNHIYDNIDGLTTNGWGGPRITTASGYIDFGPANTSHAHIYTDRPSFYFNVDASANITYGRASVRAPIFYDSNDTNYYVDPAGTSTMSTATINTIYTDTVNSSVVGDALELCYVRGSEVRIGPSGGNLPIKAATYYDYADTSYYVDPNSTSNLHALTLASNLSLNNGNIFGPQYINMRYGNSSGGAVRLYDSNGTLQSYWYGDGSGRGGLLDNDGHWAVKVGIGTEGLRLLCNNNEEFIVNENHTLAVGSSRAPIFYDSNNTNFYVNPDGTTSANFNGDINFGGELNMVSTTAENKYIDHHGDLRFRYSNNSSFFNERLRIAGASNFTQATGSLRAPLFYDSDDTGYYINPNATSNCSTLQAINLQAIAGHGYGYRFWASDSYKIYMSSSGSGTWGGRVAGETTSDYNMYFRMTGGTNRGFVFSAGSAGTTKVAGIDASGNGRFIGDVVAYSSSDARLKENLEVIPNALDKVQALSGYTFDWNDKQDAYEVGKRDVGVIAQDVEAVLPEVVVDRELTGYKAVNYEKLVPLLIEAIKELKAEVETLKKG
jgi:hypothetical protein